MATEAPDPRFADLDAWPAGLAVSAIIEGQLAAVACVAQARDLIASAVEAAVSRLRDGAGRLVYVGAGTSGRLAVQDGVELCPTFGWPWERLLFCLAGGEAALMRAVEDAEDDGRAGAGAIEAADVGSGDVVIGVAASGRTPYTLGALEAAARLGALTVGIANNPATPVLTVSAFPILLDTGPEPVTGSTRMRAGTAQKVALNTFSTAVMVQLGRVYKGRMVGMQATNGKLRQRAVQIVADLTGADHPTARGALATCSGDIRSAVLAVLGIDTASERRAMLEAAGGNLRGALSRLIGE
jgi:N-acetylmuramic acid 6-phosphate etherase